MRPKGEKEGGLGALAPLPHLLCTVLQNVSQMFKIHYLSLNAALYFQMKTMTCLNGLMLCRYVLVW